MLTHVWIIPATTFVSFWLILFFGKRLPRKGSEIGVAALVICFVLSCIVFTQWVTHEDNAIKYVPVTAQHSLFDFGQPVHNCPANDSRDSFCNKLYLSSLRASSVNPAEMGSSTRAASITGVKFDAGSGEFQA